MTTSLFGSISKEYCLYFFLLSVIFFTFTVLGAISVLFYGLSKKKGVGFYLKFLPLIITYALAYLQNRLLYNMCNNSI